MRKIIFFIISFLFIFSSFASACDLSKFRLGNSLSSFEKEKQAFLIGEPIKGINSITLPVEFVCQNSKFNGTIISLFFIDEKVIRIIFQNQVVQNRELFKLANNVYKVGFIKNQKIIDKNEPEQYGEEKNGVYYLYANLRGINENKGNFLELFEIVDKKHEDVATKEALILEENE